MKNAWMVVLLFALSGCRVLQNQLNNCIDEHVPPNWAKLEADLKTAQQRWQSAKLATYSYTFEATCFCPVINWRVSVSPTTVTVTDTATNEIKSFSAQELNAYRIEGRLASLGQTMQSHKTCDHLNATYDAQGVPTSMNWERQERYLADAFYGFRISGFTKN